MKKRLPSLNIKNTVLTGALSLAMALVTNAQGTEIIQTFDSSWTISPWDYYGNVAAMQWHYIPYTPWDPSLGTLQMVEIVTSISGVRTLATEPVSIRYSFVTGWAPADYQFYDQLTISPGEATFSTLKTFTWSTPAPLLNWLTYDYLPQANYYFESRTVDAQHSILAATTLKYSYIAAAPEPATYTMLLAGLGLMGFVRRPRKDLAA